MRNTLGNGRCFKVKAGEEQENAVAFERGNTTDVSRELRTYDSTIKRNRYFKQLPKMVKKVRANIIFSYFEWLKERHSAG